MIPEMYTCSKREINEYIFHSWTESWTMLYKIHRKKVESQERRKKIKLEIKDENINSVLKLEH